MLSAESDTLPVGTGRSTPPPTSGGGAGGCGVEAVGVVTVGAGAAGVVTPGVEVEPALLLSTKVVGTPEAVASLLTPTPLSEHADSNNPDTINAEAFNAGIADLCSEFELKLLN